MTDAVFEFGGQFSSGTAMFGQEKMRVIASSNKRVAMVVKATPK